MKKIAVIFMTCVVAGMFPVAGGTWTKWFPVPSLHPLYTEADLVFLPQLVGTWQVDGEDSKLNFERFEFVDLLGLTTKSGYLLTVEVSGRKSVLDARLLRLGDELFLDLITSNNYLAKAIEGEIYQPILPVHAFGRVRIEGDVLRLSTLQDCVPLICTDEDQKKLRIGPGISVEAIVLRGGALSNDVEAGIVLTAATKELQAFVLKHLDDYFSFKDEEFLHRVPHPLKGERQKDDPDSMGGNQDGG